MILPEGVKIFTLENFLPEVHIRREFHTYPENFKSLAIIVLAGESRRINTVTHFSLGHYHIIGTVKIIIHIKATILELAHYSPTKKINTLDT